MKPVGLWLHKNPITEPPEVREPALPPPFSSLTLHCPHQSLHTLPTVPQLSSTLTSHCPLAILYTNFPLPPAILYTNFPLPPAILYTNFPLPPSYPLH